MADNWEDYVSQRIMADARYYAAMMAKGPDGVIDFSKVDGFYDWLMVPWKAQAEAAIEANRQRVDDFVTRLDWDKRAGAHG